VSRYVAGADSATSSAAYGAAAPYARLLLWFQNSVASVRVPSGDSSRVAVSSVTTARKTSAAPAPRPGAISGRVTRRSVPIVPSPRLRATESSTGGACASAARAVTTARGMNKMA